MFRKLRNKLILINLSITSFVILVIFTTIYVISTKSAENRPMKLQNYFNQESLIFEDANGDGVPDDFEDMINFSIKKEKESAAESLLITLIVSGVAIELVVVLVSYLMAEEAIKPVKEAYESQKIFIANASHEIKTPLAAISANLEAADIHDNKWIANVERETTKLTALNSALLNLARTDLVNDVKISEVNLKELTLKVIDGFEPRLKGKILAHSITISGKVKICAADFEQILNILLDNAVKYAEKNINLKLMERTLEISNDGKAIAPEKLPHIFDRFYQVDKSADGVGLGLAIAKAVAERNRWKLACKSNHRTTFTLYF